MKDIMRQYSVARTPQQNGVAKWRNRTLIEAARTILADLKLPTTFWAEAVNTACYVQNKVLVVKPHNKTPYELLHGRTPALSFMRPFGCPVTILNNKDHLGKFDRKADKGFFVGYFLNSKIFRVFNNRTRIVEENLHVSDNGKKVDKDPRQESECKDQEKDDNVNITNNVNAAGTNEVNVVGVNTNNKLPFDSEMPKLEDISTFNFLNEDEDGDEAVNEEMDDSLERAATTATSLDVEQDRGEVDASKQGRIADIDANKETYLVNVHTDKDIFGVNDDDVIVEDAEMLFNVVDDLRDQLMLDEELALKLQAEDEEEERIAREKAQQIKEVNVGWDDVQSKINADYELAQRLQAEEQDALIDAEKEKLFMEFLVKRTKFFATKRVEEKRNRPPTKAQQRSIMSTYLKNMDGWKIRSLKKKSFAEIQELFDKAMKRVNTFVDFRTELVEESFKKAKAEITQEGSLKRTRDDLEQERSKKQKVKNDKESEELTKCLDIIPDNRDEVTIDATPLASNKMLDREDVEVLRRLVKDRFENTMYAKSAWISYSEELEAL
nr:retrovirus-related Pol polyprotein from transposon TNT 1-94 [Tanacetum cinerariifolium]